MTDAPGQIDIAEVRRRLLMPAVCAREGIVLKKVGAWLVGLCPFHEEKRPSFQVGSQRPDRWTCRGCGRSGDVIDFWMARHDLPMAEALRQLASLCGLSARVPGVVWKRPAARVVSDVAGVTPTERKKPPLPRMRALRSSEIEGLARRRGLSVEGVRVAAETFGRVGYCDWPQWLSQRDGAWRPGGAMAPSWVVTDEERWVAQFRRLDGENYPVKRGKAKEQEQEQESIKAWTKGSPTWPLGAAALGERKRVLFVEGGADMLAGYHFLHGFGLLNSVAVVCMLGVHNRIAAEALPFFAGCRVRLMMDADPVKEHAVKGKDGTVQKIRKTRASADGGLRWQEQLTAAGAVVESFSLEGLTRVDGQAVKDLNDLALCSAEVVGSEEILEAFYEWDF